MSVSRAYLVLYNTVQFLGWSALFVQILLHFKNGGTVVNLYDAVQLTLKIFQTGAVLEIVHAGAGIVRSSVPVTFQQVFSRVYVTWAILHLFPTTRVSVGVLLLLLTWTVTEMIRYSMYAVQQVSSSTPYFLTWLRYTFFIVAYPTGVSGELLCSYQAFQEALKTGAYSVTLPNVMNATFWFPLVIAVIGLMYIPLFPPMYLHMFAQRRKVLGGEAKKTV